MSLLFASRAAGPPAGRANARRALPLRTEFEIMLLIFLSSRLSQRTLGSMASRPVFAAMDPSFDTRGRWGDGDMPLLVSSNCHPGQA